MGSSTPTKAPLSLLVSCLLSSLVKSHSCFGISTYCFNNTVIALTIAISQGGAGSLSRFPRKKLFTNKKILFFA